MALEECAVCGREWEPGQTPVPTVYTVKSIESGDPPAPVCDYCVEANDAVLFAELRREREHFWAN